MNGALGGEIAQYFRPAGRTRKIIALCLVATHFFKGLQLLDRLHSFGYHVQVHLLTDGDDGRDNPAILLKVLDKLLVNLQRADGHFLQIA